MEPATMKSTWRHESMSIGIMKFIESVNAVSVVAVVKEMVCDIRKSAKKNPAERAIKPAVLGKNV